MTEEEKQLLLKDLCARLPYGVKVDVNFYYATKELSCDLLKDFISEEKSVRPYLRPMTSMTGKEKQSYYKLMDNLHFAGGSFYSPDIKDWLDEHHFDYRGLIEKGLALEAPADMYKTE